MIVNCPACGVRFLVPDEALGATGRKVRCGSCSHTWHQAPETLITGQEYKTATPEPRQVFTPAEAKSNRVVPARRQGFARRARRLALAATMVLLIGGGGILTMPRQIVSAWEPIARFYTHLGITVPVLGEGLTFDKIELYTRRNSDDSFTVLVHGQVINNAATPRAVPKVLVSLRDPTKRPVLQWLASDTLQTLQPGESLVFTSQHALTNQLAASAQITFTDKQAELKP
ncbi:MAG: DUF3426 domain-containing protein [Holosporales bacterium]